MGMPSAAGITSCTRSPRVTCARQRMALSSVASVPIRAKAGVAVCTPTSVTSKGMATSAPPKPRTP